MKYGALICLLLTATAARAQLDAIRTLTVTNGQEVLRPVESNLFVAVTAELPAFETELLDIFQSPETTLEGKQYACRMLRHCASDSSIPVLAAALSDPDLSQFARLVLQGIDSPAADRALIKALPSVDEMIRIGIIGTLGQRGSEKSVKAIKPWLEDSNPALQLAAITSLGSIGGRDAAKALEKAKVVPALSTARKHALLQCATKIKPRSAWKIYDRMLKEPDPDIRAAAWVGLTGIDPKKTAPTVLTLLDAEERRMQQTALGLLPQLPTDPLVQAGRTANSTNRAAIIDVLSARPEPGVEDAVIQMMSDTNAVVQTAGYAALGKIGGNSSLDLLIAAAPGNKDALNALCALRTEGTDERIVATLKDTDNEQTGSVMLKCLARRRSRSALPTVVKAAEGPWNTKTKAAIATFGALVQTDEFAIYSRLLATSQEEEKLKALEKSIPQAAHRQTDIAACTLPLIEGFATAGSAARNAILRTLGNMGGEPARDLLTQSLSQPDLKDAALRGLCSWPNIDVADLLLEQARTAADEQHRVLALRGYIRLAGTVGEFEVVYEMCQWATEAAEHPEELKGIISCLKRFRKPEVLDFLILQLDNTEVFYEVAWAVCEISSHRDLQQPSIYALRQIIEFAADEDLIAEANRKLVKYLEQPAV